MISSMLALLSFLVIASPAMGVQQNENESLRVRIREALQVGDFDLAVHLVQPFKQSEDPELRLAVADVYFMRAELGAGSSSEKACDIGRAFAITLDEAREGSQVAASTLSAAYSFGDFGLPKDEVAAACWDRLTRPGATAECAAPRLEALDEGACRGSGKQGNASFSED